MPGSIEAVVGSESASIGRKVLFPIEENYYTYFARRLYETKAHVKPNSP
jgi:hypothetical protein